MIHTKKRLCSICARGGSKGIKNKNLRSLLGKPLIVHTLEHARDSKLFDAIAVSSDSSEILEISRKFGVDVLVKRPAELATDTAPKIPAIRHCAKEAGTLLKSEFETFVDLDCTSPLRIVQDIIDAVKLLENEGASNVFSVTPARRSPFFDMVEINAQGMVETCRKAHREFFRRQDVPPAYDLNASIYVWDKNTLMNSDSLYNLRTKLFIMPHERSVEIDSEIDFLYTELLLSREISR